MLESSPTKDMLVLYWKMQFLKAISGSKETIVKFTLH